MSDLFPDNDDPLAPTPHEPLLPKVWSSVKSYIHKVFERKPKERPTVYLEGGAITVDVAKVAQSPQGKRTLKSVNSLFNKHRKEMALQKRQGMLSDPQMKELMEEIVRRSIRKYGEKQNKEQ